MLVWVRHSKYNLLSSSPRVLRIAVSKNSLSRSVQVVTNILSKAPWNFLSYRVIQLFLQEMFEDQRSKGLKVQLALQTSNSPFESPHCTS